MLTSSFLPGVLTFLVYILTINAAVLQRRAFTLKSYPDFQISTGTAGKAQAAANAVFVDPFKGVNLATASSTDLANVNTMAKAAVDAEEDFNSAIAKIIIYTEEAKQKPFKATSDSATKAALNAGKTVNKVLKLTGEVQVLNIQAAQGKNVAAKLKTEQAKLTENLKKDAAQVGVKMQSFLD
ncbi:uncharacterized protein MELLADRAFT_103900 [Melampsora larici-populina 98AG31]|uniref:Secreted protein n=1 Tax=Melampsora larici-populina (strain 98AG31 / pathotype 3-4-7) TaxID=747676 RepID=F4RCX6_MELLP|nr:uncharacterized protein MELLADRAFT_103900 [Melampsora larici-populina 98AG31]EGG09802.1 hypothetical protein MELLADRAFT_103900 [Melampsora larici-populina 98AG31]